MLDSYYIRPWSMIKQHSAFGRAGVSHTKQRTCPCKNNKQTWKSNNIKEANIKRNNKMWLHVVYCDKKIILSKCGLKCPNGKKKDITSWSYVPTGKHLKQVNSTNIIQIVWCFITVYIHGKSYYQLSASQLFWGLLEQMTV